VLDALHVLGALVLLVAASDAFTNAVEWIGALYGLTRSAVGAVVAAVGSSLPETMVAFIAFVLLGDTRSVEVGTGAVIGAPLLLSTVALCLLGIGAYAFGRQRTVVAHIGPTLFGLALFASTFALVIGASFAHSRAVHIGAASVALLAYVWYLIYHMRAGEQESDESPPPLRFAPKTRRPSGLLVALQLVVAAVVTALAARWFVGTVSSLADEWRVSALLISIVLTPIATELPEIVNLLIWTQRDLDDLALGNIIGAMMFQTSIASAIALFATTWQLDATSYRAAIATLTVTVILFVWTALRRKVEVAPLLVCGLGYIAYLIAEFHVTPFTGHLFI
jgi:cation:H+ antiporter